MAPAAGKPKEQPIIIRRIKKSAAGHHGGAWKVAYADFVTAMMAFFLLLWLLNVTTNIQRKGIADYFAPASISESQSGAGGVFGGRTVSAPEAKINDTSEPSIETMEPQPASAEEDANNGQGKPDNAGNNSPQNQVGAGAAPKAMTPEQQQQAAVAAVASKQEQERFEAAEQAIKEAVAGTPDLHDLAKSLLVDETEDGLRIQIIDRDNYSMFPRGSAEMYPHTRQLLQAVAKVIAKLPNRLSISGHTDSSAYAAGAKRSNWDLSADRANASRRVLEESGIPEDRIQNVVGRADREPFDAKDPQAASNRRISIVLLRDAVAKKQDAAAADENKPEPAPAPAPVVAAPPTAVPDNEDAKPVTPKPPPSILE